MECKFCSRSINNKGSLVAHQMVCKSNEDRIKFTRSPNAGAKKGSIAWNRGKTIRDDERILKGSIKLKEGYSSGRLKPKCYKHTSETKKKLSTIAKKRKLGGYVKGSGIGKSGKYKGIYCDSSWELAYVIFGLDHNIQVKRNKQILYYYFEGSRKKYIPDFIVDGVLVEIKGYTSKQWEAKLKDNPGVVVFYEKEMQPILSYVIEKYGKNFIDLYE